MHTAEQIRTESASDEELVRRVLAGEVACFELLIRRNNQRLWRTVRSVVKSDDEAEDVMQEAYVAAFSHLGDFEGKARFSTWLSRIAVHEAFARTRRMKRLTALDDVSGENPSMSSSLRGPEQRASDRELGLILENAVDSLAEPFRIVFVLRTVEQLSVAETSEILDIPEETVKTRLHRARTQLKSMLTERIGAQLPQLFDFHLSRCDRVVDRVFARLGIER
ncbi:MAG TPA: RNA polymerase sigma factor [Polyangiaceae bacterium]|nr:RNA polymerase sigma factor [Polyangiaceae bacterium]